MAKKKSGPCSIEHVDHAIIEQQLLVSLSDRSKVALMLDVVGLITIISALESSPTRTPYGTGMLRDLKQLQAAAFPGSL